jgi:TonB-dependent starch-binding outer membrane protein SusC
MNCFRIRSVLRAGALLALLVAFSGRTLRAQQGSVAGQVTDKATQQPIVGAQVLIFGTSLQALTNREGRYTIARVPAGRYQMQARLLGYASATVPVTVAAETATANFAMTAAAVSLDVVTVSATGQEQTKREVGNAVAVVDAAKVIQEAAPDNASDLFNSRVPGVVVQQAGGTTGTSSRIRIRGATSLALSNEPLVVVDGVRIETNPAAINFNSSVAVGGQTPSRLNDIPTDDIQTFEVVKGPSAAVLYGTDAANGVISITTQHGRPGPTKFSASVEGGTLNDVTNWPANYEAVDASGSPCSLGGGCTIAKVNSYNPLLQNSPFREGVNQHYNMNASGGNDVTTFYLSGDFQREKGIYSSSDLRKTSVRANLRDQISDRMDLTVNTGYITSNLALPQNDNNNQGILSSGLLGFPNTTNGGYGFATPSQITQILTSERVERFIGGATANYRPVSFLSMHGTVGYDATTQGDDELTPPNVIPLSASQLQGNAAQFRGQIFGYTGSFTTTATARLNPAITSNTSVGAQFYKNVWQQVQAAGRSVVAGTQGVSGVVFPSVHDTTAPFVTLGGFAEEDIAIHERLYLTAAVRGDRNSSFGQNFSTIYYPKVSGSWVISEEPFFPQLSWLSSLRLRAAWGKSGRAPAPLDALQFSTPVAVALNGTDVAGITIGSAGNTDLKPEQTREIETGFDVDALQQRLHIEATYYDKDSKDALVDVPLAGSVGVTSTRLANLGEISNQGVELLVTAQVLNTPNVTWSLTASAWGNKNRVLSTGPGNTPIIFGLGGATQRLQVGYPAGGYWGLPYTYSTVGGIVQPSSITFGAADVFQGSSTPTHGATLSSEVNFLQHFRLYGLLDGRFGNRLDNATESFRCLFGICAALNLVGSSPADQAAAQTAPVTETGFFQDAGFVKLRELSLTYLAPAEWASRIGASTLSFTVTGRNLVTWTSYKGADPEINTNPGIDNFSVADFLSQPPVRYFLARINVTF